MWILATLTDVEALEFLTQLLPLKVRLDEASNADRVFGLSAPPAVARVEGWRGAVCRVEAGGGGETERHVVAVLCGDP